MRRGELYLVRKSGSSNPKNQRGFVVVSREYLIQSKFSTVICAPVFSRHDGMSTQVAVGIAQGLKHESSVHCDELMSLPKSVLTHYVGRLDAEQLEELDQALRIALEVEEDF